MSERGTRTARRAASATLGLLLSSGACRQAGPSVPEPAASSSSPAAAASAAASSSPTASPSSSEAPAPTTSAPPEPRVCSPRPARAPVAFAITHETRSLERRGPVRVWSDLDGVALATGEPAFVGAVASADAAARSFLDEEHADWARAAKERDGRGTNFDPCYEGCWFEGSCSVSRDDGEYLTMTCDSRPSSLSPARYWPRPILTFRREGDELRRVESWELFELEGPPSRKNLVPLFAALKRRCGDTEAKTVERFDLELESLYLDLDSGGYWGGQCRIPYPDLAAELGCGSLPASGVPTAGTERVPGPPPALAFAIHIGAIGLLEVNVPRFWSVDPRRAAAAATVDDDIQRWIQGAERDADGKGYASCQATMSTPSLVSVLCTSSGSDADGFARRASFTYRLGETAQRIAASALFDVSHVGALPQHCLGDRLGTTHQITGSRLDALPSWTPEMLTAFGLGQTGVLLLGPTGTSYDWFANHENRHELLSCFVPYTLLGTNADALARAAATPR